MYTAIIILAWKTIDEANALSNKILNWSSEKPKIIIVCNESNPQKKYFHFDKIIYIHEKQNRGFGGGNNIGMQKASSLGYTHALLLNPDAIIDQDNFIQLVKTFNQHQDAFAIGPIIHEGNNDKRVLLYGGRNITEQLNTRITESKVNANTNVNQVDYCVGASVMVCLKKADSLKYFDEEFFFSGEMADLCYRARLKGYLSYVDLDSSANHNIDPTENHRKYMYLYYSMRNRFLFMAKHQYSLKTKVFWYNILLRQLFNGIIKLDMQLIKTISLVTWHVLMGKYGNQNQKFEL